LQTASSTAALAALGLDLEGSLSQEPRFLHDATLLGALHAELTEALGDDEGGAALFQLGFVHGLRDGALKVRDGLAAAAHGGAGAPPSPTWLPMRLAPLTHLGPILAMRGSWPGAVEAQAVVGSLGPASGPRCHVSSGYTSGWLSASFGTALLALETSCGCRGDSECGFIAQEPEGWLDSEDPYARTLLEGVPFDDLRRLVDDHLDRTPAEPTAESFEAGSPAIHVWGPVMVLPFAGPEESLRALELIGTDPEARQVRVVVVDLTGTIIDDSFGALALERILESALSWGAEPLLAGVSPLSEAVVADLEQSHVVIHKDLPEAIAAAFQIADAQRCQL